MLHRSKARTTDFPTLMDAFCEKASLDPLIPDAQGQYKIELNGDDRPIFCCKDSSGTGIIYSCVMAVLPDNGKSTELIMDLLSVFTGLLKSRHEVICSDKQRSEIVLFRRFSLKTATAEYFYSALEDFVNSLYSLRSVAASGVAPRPAKVGGMHKIPKINAIRV
jgi:hypothetical protein